MKVKTICTECKKEFMRRIDKVADRNFCCVACSNSYKTGKPLGNGEWARLGRKEYMRVYLKKYSSDNIDAHNARSREWVKKNQEKRKQISSKWQKNNKEKGLAIVNARRANKLNATPLWAKKHVIDHIYLVAKMIQEQSNIKVHVDHIVPLKNKMVCGLHCEQNLRVMWAKDNLIKSNNYDCNDAVSYGPTHGLTPLSKKQVEALYPVEIEVV